jgi:hypothetical protein
VSRSLEGKELRARDPAQSDEMVRHGRFDVDGAVDVTADPLAYGGFVEGSRTRGGLGVGDQRLDRGGSNRPVRRGSSVAILLRALGGSASAVA